MLSEINILYEPLKDIVVMDYMRFNIVDDLVRFLNVAAGGKPTGIYWTKGVAFFYYPISPTTETATKALIEEKKIFWAFIGYALLPEYRPVIETKEKIMVPVIDMSTNEMFHKVAQWLKERE